MAHPIESDSAALTVQSRVWIEEHDWLYGIFKCSDNSAPKFRLPDLLSACVALALSDDDSVNVVIRYLTTELTLRDPRSQRRSCDIWALQFELLLSAHRAPWNRFPNPMFELDNLTTACVAVVMAAPDAQVRVLNQARSNFVQRTMAAGNAIN